MRKAYFFCICCVGLVTYSATSALAQGPGSGGPQPGGSPTVIPIDGGASLLLAGGAAFALRKLRRQKAPQ
ncbi:MprA protease, GlyGly-CTERM protein-sorting domain-containing form [Hymenobacter koreensis]|uniref:VPDSG-CTERM protein sorting domain-containing protein n=1 Tax=Hymenobacter koreensis TaxID=1084523 RepID=A0ABP8J4M3_9BACT